MIASYQIPTYSTLVLAWLYINQLYKDSETHHPMNENEWLDLSILVIIYWPDCTSANCTWILYRTIQYTNRHLFQNLDGVKDVLDLIQRADERELRKLL